MEHGANLWELTRNRHGIIKAGRTRPHLITGVERDIQPQFLCQRIMLLQQLPLASAKILFTPPGASQK